MEEGRLNSSLFLFGNSINKYSYLCANKQEKQQI